MSAREREAKRNGRKRWTGKQSRGIEKCQLSRERWILNWTEKKSREAGKEDRAIEMSFVRGGMDSKRDNRRRAETQNKRIEKCQDVSRDARL